MLQLGQVPSAAKPQAQWLNSAHLLLQGYTALSSPTTFCLFSQTCRNITETCVSLSSATVNGGLEGGGR